MPGLVELPLDGPGYTVAITRNHGRANWLTPHMLSRMQQLSYLFPRYVPPGTQAPDLVYTAMNLEWGGLYDIWGDWTTPHGTHDDGRDVDVDFPLPQGNISQTLLRALGQAIADACVVRRSEDDQSGVVESCLDQPIPGERTFDPAANHYHVRGAS